MLILAAALLVAGPTSARAEDAPSVQAPERDPADADGDGVVTGKERRQLRRAQRRARRGERGPNGEVLSDEEADAADAAESSARSSAASGKASAAAAALKSSLPSMDAAGGMPGGGAKPADSPGGASPSGQVPSAGTPGGAKTYSGDFSGGASGDPGRPKAPSDFALAARSGYAPAFAAAGLKLGPDGKSVVRLDGKPATAEDYARLQREISSMPAALGRRPDFFSVVSPQHYADLKRGYKEKKEGDTVYKDVGTTAEDRDFVHTASCEKLSGGCNKNVEKASYKKGDFVAPEDLDSMWDALQKELDGSAEGGAGGLPSLATTRSDISRAAAMDAARSLSYSAGEEDAIRIATGEGAKPAPTQVSKAVASLGRLWKKASSMASPEKGGSEGGGSGAPIALGALALTVLGAGALFLRRKG